MTIASNVKVNYVTKRIHIRRKRYFKAEEIYEWLMKEEKEDDRIKVIFT